MRAIRWAAGLEGLMVPIESVHQHENNPNNGDVEALIESIQINGFNTVITVDRETNQIVAGNHRWQALHALGATHVPVVYVDRVDSKSDIRYLLADNEIGRLARMDPMGRFQLLKELHDDSNLGLAGVGVSEAEYLKAMSEVLQMDNALPEGFGGAMDKGPAGIFQVVLDFDNPEDRDEAYEELARRYDGFPGLRKANL